MALSDTQKHQIMFVLGWPLKTLDSTSTDYSRIIVQRLDNLSTAAETLAVDALDAVMALRTKLTASQGRMLVKKVGDIEINSDEPKLLANEYNRLTKELSEILDIPRLGSRGRNIPLVL